MRQRRIMIALDQTRGLLSEWEQTCGRGVVGPLLARWESLQGILLIDNLPCLDRRITRRLRSLGFQDTIDKVVLRLALAIDGRVVVSDDCDFWDPRKPTSRGDRNACVARLCREQLSVTVMVLGMLVQRLDT